MDGLQELVKQFADPPPTSDTPGSRKNRKQRVSALMLYVLKDMVISYQKNKTILIYLDFIIQYK